MECELLKAIAPIGEICPSVYNLDGDVCCEECGFIKNNTITEKEKRI